MANLLLDIGKGLEVAAEDVLKWGANVQTAGKSVNASPTALAALGVLASGVEKAIVDAQGDVTNPLSLLFTAPEQYQDFKAVWPELKTMIESLGIKKI